MSKVVNGSVLERQKSEYAMRKALKEQVEDYEIRARKWKAEYEMMEYAMKVNELKSKYEAFVESLQKQAQEAYETLSTQANLEEVTDAEG